MGGSPEHWLIVGVVVVLLFGSKKLPDLARGLGRSMRILKADSRASKDEASTPNAPVPTETNGRTTP